jgi:RES domain-containing protein
MTLWRISRHRDLCGAGDLKVSGRWRHAGQPVVYLAQSPAAALLDVCVRTSGNDAPPEFILLKIEGPDPKVSAITLDDLPENWRSLIAVTRDLGAVWLRKKQSVLLQIPRLIVPETENFLFNPLHPDAKSSASQEYSLIHLMPVSRSSNLTMHRSV